MRLFAFAIVLPCALIGGGTWALSSPRWNVAGVAIEGVEATPTEQVEVVARALLGQNWLRVDLAAASARLHKMPPVRVATVSRSWKHWPPSLEIRIQERRPWVRLGGGATWWIVDATGVAFRRATRSDSERPAITATAFDARAMRAGRKVDSKVWDGVRRLGLALDQTAQRGEPWRLRRAYLDRDNMASLRLEGGSQNEMLVRLGAGLWPQKMERAHRALAFFEAVGRRAASLNLVSFSMPTWTPLQPKPDTPQTTPSTTATANPDADSPARASTSDAPREDSARPSASQNAGRDNAVGNALGAEAQGPTQEQEADSEA